MIIDLILDRKNEQEEMWEDNYDPKKFYNELLEYNGIFDGIANDILSALDYGTENNIRMAIIKYLESNNYAYNELVEWVNKQTWLNVRKTLRFDSQGETGNIFVILSNASNLINDKEKSFEMFKRVQKSKSYKEALSIINEYVFLVDVSEWRN